MEDKERPLDEQLAAARAQAALELAELRSKDIIQLTPRALVRKAILLQFEEASEGDPKEIEELLHLALRQDDRHIEAYIELGRYYYAIEDDSPKAKTCFLKALTVLRDLCEGTIQGLLDCDGEINPNKDRLALREGYEEIVLGRRAASDVIDPG